MQIILRGPAAGYEAEHTARLFFPGAEKSENLPQEGDFVLAQSHQCTDLALLRLNGKLQWQTALRPQGEDAEYALCRLLYGMLCRATGITPPWGMMTGVRPVRIIHDMRAAGAGEDEIRARFLDHFGCAPEKFALALGIADLQKSVLDAADPMDCSVYAGIPFCPTRCSYCSFVSRTVGDKATRALVQPYVDKLCEELTAIRRTADRAGLHIRTFYIGGGTPTSLNAPQLEQLMSHIAKTFDLAKLDEYTVEAGRPDCTDAEKLRIIKKYGATRISINPQTFSDTVLQNIGRRHTAQDIIDCFAAARAAGHTNINMDLIAGLPHEDLRTFGESFNTGYALGAQMLQLGFLKLLHGAAMREEPEEFPCVFSEDPPYEVQKTPWLLPEELDVLRAAEDALERCYNSGRFLETAAYAMAAAGLSPFVFYCRLGAAGARHGTANIPLDDYTAFLYNWCAALPGIDKACLRDAMVRDRLATNSTGRLPQCLHVTDALLGRAVKRLAQNPATAPLPGVRRGVALLYGTRQVVFVDYTQKNPVTGRYLLHTRSIDNLFTE